MSRGGAGKEKTRLWGHFTLNREYEGNRDAPISAFQSPIHVRAGDVSPKEVLEPP